MVRYSTSSRRQREERERHRRRYEDRQQGRQQVNEDSIKRRPKRKAAPREFRVYSDSDDTEMGDHAEPGVDTPGGRRRNGQQLQQSNYGFAMRQQENNDDDRFYVIQELLEKRYDLQGNEEYLVRWQNYPPEYDSWEPRAELEKNSLDMIEEFNRIPNGVKREDELHCICKRPYRFDQGGMILCDNCKKWYHFSCLQMNMVEANSYAKYNCQDCRNSNSGLKNIIKRDKVNSLFGNTQIVDIEKVKILTEEEPFTV